MYVCVQVCHMTQISSGWLSLRYYWTNENVRVRIINCDVKYAYEYLGNSPRLVITPVDRSMLSYPGKASSIKP